MWGIVRSERRFRFDGLHMTFYDIFNGDADGICALQQLRLTAPCTATLVTGAKRDTNLLKKVAPAAGDQLTVLDISLHSNAASLSRILDAGARVNYFDHHFAGEIPSHPNLQAHIDTAPDVCTSLIVDRHLGGKHRAWAVVAAFGDNLRAAASAAAAPLDLDAARLRQLRELGELINYNAYGDTVADLYFAPAELYRTLSGYADPFEFIAGEAVFAALAQGYAADMAEALRMPPDLQTPACAVFVLPDAPWARRVSGSISNSLASAHPDRAHAVLSRRNDVIQVSVRAPNSKPQGADVLCMEFETGGGRAGAAGINRLPPSEYHRFLAAFERRYSTS